MSFLSQPVGLRRRAEQTASELAGRGVELPVIVAEVLEAVEDQIDREATTAVPPRGRSFWGAMATAILWGAATDVLLLLFGPSGGGHVPVLKLCFCIGVMTWAVFFGVVAGGHKVRDRRVVGAVVRREAVARVSADAARRVWSRQVPGSWQPLGPEPDLLMRVDDSVTTAWLRRFAVAPGAALALVVDGTMTSLRQSVRAAHGIPVVLFVAAPGFFVDEARTLADLVGMALFAAAPDGLHSMSDVASSVLRGLQDPNATQPPGDAIVTAWKAVEARVVAEPISGPRA